MFTTHFPSDTLFTPSSSSEPDMAESGLGGVLLLLFLHRHYAVLVVVLHRPLVEGS